MKSLFKKTFSVMAFAVSFCAFAEILPENPKAESIVPLLPKKYSILSKIPSAMVGCMAFRMKALPAGFSSHS